MDGEGCIVVGSNGSLQLRIINTSLRSLERIQQTLGGTVKSRKQMVNKPQYYWSIYGPDARQVLEDLAPYLTAKWDQAITAIEYYDANKAFPRSYANVIHRKVMVDMVRAKLTKLKFND